MSRRRSLLQLVEHFWTLVDKSGDCWLWTGQLNNKGYGVYPIYENDTCDKLLAHRFSAILAGLPVHGPGDVVMHRCDTPRCVRPDHFSVGTQVDNMRDALIKGRLNVAGLQALTPKTCGVCGVPFSGVPASRYCPEHAPTPRIRNRRRSA